MVYRNKEGYADPTAGAAIHEAEPKAKKKEYNPEVTNLVSVLKQMIDIAGYEMVGRIVLREAVNRLIKMTTQKTAGQRPNTTHINWETLDMEFMRIVCYATTLVLSGRLEELRKVTESDTIEKTEV